MLFKNNIIKLDNNYFCFQDKMKKFILNKFLVLVYILDVMKNKKVIIHEPCLFRKESKFKVMFTIKDTFM